MGDRSSAGSILKNLGASLTVGGIALMALAVLQRERAGVAQKPTPVVQKPQVSVSNTRKRAGGAPATVASTQPKLLSRIEPEYSQEARAAKYSGTVHVSVVVGTDGRLTDVQVLDSPGLGLDEKIMECLEKWRFAPATKAGVAIPEKATIAVTFRFL